MSLSDLKKNNPRLYKYCKQEYANEWNLALSNAGGKIPKSKRTEIQSNIIDKLYLKCLKKYPKTAAIDVWDVIHAVHGYMRADLEGFGLSEADCIKIYDNVVTAHQSRNSESGHHLERLIAQVANNNAELKAQGIEVVLQKELSDRIKKGEIVNEPDDLDFLKQRIHDDAFDLYALETTRGETVVFGCIQSKTSIRDRVSRDREPSADAMSHRFWSAAIVLHGDGLKSPKYINMVNGGDSYQQNGWHGMYAMAGIDTDNDRIYVTDSQLTLFAHHAVLADKHRNRGQFDNTWRP